jgi:hypothetical protein
MYRSSELMSLIIFVVAVRKVSTTLWVPRDYPILSTSFKSGTASCVKDHKVQSCAQENRGDGLGRSRIRIRPPSELECPARIFVSYFPTRGAIRGAYLIIASLLPTFTMEKA